MSILELAFGPWDVPVLPDDVGRNLLRAFAEHLVCSFHFAADHAGADGNVRKWVDQYEAAGRVVHSVWVEENRLRRSYLHAADIIQAECRHLVAKIGRASCREG